MLNICFAFGLGHALHFAWQLFGFHTIQINGFVFHRLYQVAGVIRRFGIDGFIDGAIRACADGRSSQRSGVAHRIARNFFTRRAIVHATTRHIIAQFGQARIIRSHHSLHTAVLRNGEKFTAAFARHFAPNRRGGLDAAYLNGIHRNVSVFGLRSGFLHAGVLLVIVMRWRIADQE